MSVKFNNFNLSEKENRFEYGKYLKKNLLNAFVVVVCDISSVSFGFIATTAEL